MAIQGQLTKTVGFLGPRTQATNASSVYTVDTQGFDWAEIEVAHNPVTAGGTAKWALLQLWHGAATVATNATTGYAIISSGTTNSATTATNQFVIPDGNSTAVAGIVKWSVNLADKERYLAVVATGVDATAVTVAYTARLSRGTEAKGTAAGQGVNAFVVV